MMDDQEPLNLWDYTPAEGERVEPATDGSSPSAMTPQPDTHTYSRGMFETCATCGKYAEHPNHTPAEGERDGLAERLASSAMTPQPEIQTDDYELLHDLLSQALDTNTGGDAKTYTYTPDTPEIDDADADEQEPIEVVPGQASLFGDNDQFTIAGQEWQGMPEYVSGNLTPWKSMLVHFESYDDMRAFADLIKQPNITVKTKSVWYPEQDVFHFVDKRYAAEGEAS